MMHYAIQRAADSPSQHDPWASKVWDAAEILQVNHFHPRSSPHRPTTRAKVLHDGERIYVAFHVQDRYVRCVHDQYQSMVSRDSCVEFFLQPRPGGGYFNFEINCGGTLLLYFIEDATRIPGALFRKFEPIPEELGLLARISASLPSRVEPELVEPTVWTLFCQVPRALLEAYCGPLGEWTGQKWRGNFFKCADQTSHPHWASWAPIGEELRFHQPNLFAPILFM